MSTSTLTLKKSDFQNKVALYLGWPRLSGEWSAEQAAYLKEFVDSACRQICYPSLDGKAYSWSWLKPVASVTLASGESEVALPGDFGGFEGELLVTPSSGTAWPVRLMNEAQVRERLASSTTTSGRPQMAAVQPLKGTTIHGGNVQQLVVYPTADADYTLTFAYYFFPDALTDQNPYAYGGMALSECYLEGCLAIAEQRLNDKADLHTAMFQKLLSAAVQQDQRLKAQTLGPNLDRSDEIYGRNRGWPYRDSNPVTYDGVVYGPG